MIVPSVNRVPVFSTVSANGLTEIETRNGGAGGIAVARRHAAPTTSVMTRIAAVYGRDSAHASLSITTTMKCIMGRMPPTDALGEFEQCLLLAILHLRDQAYGVSIRQEVERRTNRSVAVGALYTSLARLERKGYVRTELADPTPQRGGRAKRFFTLRPAGAAALRHSRARLDRMWAGLSPNLKRTDS